MTSVIGTQAQDIELLVNSSVRNDSLIIELNVHNGTGVGFSFGSAQFPIQFDDTSGLDFSNARVIEEGVWSISTSNCYQAMALGNLDSVLNVNVFPAVTPVATCTDLSLALADTDTAYLGTIGIPINDCSEEITLFRALNQGDVRFNYDLEDLEGAPHNLTYGVTFLNGSTISLSSIQGFTLIASDTVICGKDSTVVTVSGLSSTTGLSYKFHHQDVSGGSLNTLTLSGTDTTFTYPSGTIENGDSVYVEVTNGTCSDTSTAIVFTVGGSSLTVDFTNNTVCYGDSTQFEGQPFAAGNTYFWDFDDPLDPNDTLSGQFPRFAFTSLDTHFVTLTVTGSDGCSDDTTKPVTVFNVSTPDLGADTIFCSGDSMTITAAQGAGYAYSWAQDPSSPGVLTNDIYTFRVGVAGTYIVAMDSLSGFNFPVGCLRYDTIEISEYLITVDLPNDTAACASESVTLKANGSSDLHFEWFDFGNTQLSTSDTVGWDPLGVSRQVYVIVTDSSTSSVCTRRDTIQVDEITAFGSVDSAAAEVLSDSIHWTWPPVNGASSYAVYVTVDGILTVKGTSVASDTAYGLGSLGVFGIDSVEFAYEAVSSCVSVLSDSVSSVVGSCNPVSAIIDSATVGFVSADSIVFVWDSVQYATSYNVQVDVNGGGFSANTNITDTSFTVTGLSNGDSVVFRYNAVSLACNQSDSSSSQAFAFDCLVNFADIDSSTSCTSGFNLLLTPDTLTADMYFTGAGINVAFDTLFWIDLEQAGAGSHSITLTGCYGLEMHVDTINILAAPCSTTVTSTTVGVPFTEPSGIYTDCDGQIYFSDFSEDLIAVIDTFGVGRTLVGAAGSGFLDGDATTTALIAAPTGILVHPSTEVLYFADYTNHAVRQWDPVTNVVTTLAGGGPTGGTGPVAVPGDSDAPTDADGLSNSQFNLPYGLTFNG